MRRGTRPVKAKGSAKRPVARKSSKRGAPEDRQLEQRLAEALEQQTATREILRVISSSPTGVQPVFDTIVRSVVRLCEGLFSALFRFDGELIHQVAQHNFTPEGLEEVRRLYPARPSRAHGSARAILECAVVHIPDVELDPEYQHRSLTRAVGFRSGLFVPMLREGDPIGVIMVARAEPGPFSDSQIELLKTFADQAVIAIEKVRMFKEMETRNRDLVETLEQQTATSEILRVISSSQTDVQPVFDAIAAAATRLCAAENSGVFLFDGTLIRFAAHHRWTAEHLAAIHQAFPRSPGPGSVTARAILTRAVAHSADISVDPEYEVSSLVDAGFRAVLSVPMLRDGEPIGAINVTRREPIAFTDTQIALLETFAGQAVIAIENVRLFQELEVRNRDLTETLGQQTATSEILRVISRSPTNIQPVLDAVTESAARLCETSDVVIFLRDGESLRLAAHHGPIPVQPTLPLVRGTSNGRAVLDGRTVHVADMQTEADEFPEGSANARLMGHRTILCVPLMREGRAIGTIHLRRTEAQLFTDRQVALLETFADQAVIAIENVRLFKELDARNRDLTETLDQQTATGEILRVISSSPTDVQPVFDTVAESAARLCESFDSAIWRWDDDRLLLVAHSRPDPRRPHRGVFPPAHPRDGRWPIGAGRTARPRRGRAGRRWTNSRRAARTRGAWASAPSSASP